jgi:quaternary ammonium compound-resistance protein SugE
MAWFYLLVAGLLEVVWAYFLKQSHGFTRPAPAAITVAAMAASLGFLGLALRGLPLGTAYAVWTGIGTLGAFVLGIVLLGEPANALRLSAAAMIAGGLVLMKLAT